MTDQAGRAELRAADEIRDDVRTVRVWCGRVQPGDQAAHRIADDADALLSRLAVVEADRDRLRALLNDRYAPAGDAEMDDILRRAEKRIQHRAWRLVAYVVRKWSIEHAQLAAARADADSRHAQSVRIHETLDAQLADAQHTLRVVCDIRDEMHRDANDHARRHGSDDQRFRDGLMHAWSKFLPIRESLNERSGLAASRPSSPDTTEATG